MAIPDYQTLALPLLRAVAAGEASLNNCIGRLANEFRLTSEERAQLLKSGQTVFANRVYWAAVYLGKAGLLQRIRRGHYIISERGEAILAQEPARIDNKLLSQFEEFRRFRATAAAAASEVPGSEGLPSAQAMDVATPEERVEAALQEIEDGLRAEVLARVLQGQPTFFERLVLDLLTAMGYGAGADAAKHLGRGGDGGIDGLINEDPLGLNTVYIQAKRYAPGNGVGIDKIHEFAGAMAARGAAKGVFVTTSHFTEPARAAAERLPQRLILIDGEELSRLMVRYGVAVRTRTIELKKIDLDYFEAEEP